jgi:uncharacterized protein
MPLRTVTQNEPLTDAELDRLGDFLKGCEGGKAMNLEELDGFFSALIAGPETVMSSEYHAEVFGGEMSDACEFDSLDEANEILGLMMRHWNTIAGTLFKGEAYVPLLLEAENGVAHGNDWADGFMRGMNMRHEGWAELVNDDEHGGCLIPMMMLCHEHDEDPEMRPKPISPEKREQVIARMAVGLLGAYQYFRAQREADLGVHAPEPRRNAPKLGRNDPCPCGSGKKYKRLQQFSVSKRGAQTRPMLQMARSLPQIWCFIVNPQLNPQPWFLEVPYSDFGGSRSL